MERAPGARFRARRAALEALVQDERDRSSDLWPGFELIARRSAELAPAGDELRRAEASGRLTVPLVALAPSLLHMHAVRLLRSAQRAQELVLYDFLARIYQSRLARARRG